MRMGRWRLCALIDSIDCCYYPAKENHQRQPRYRNHEENEEKFRIGAPHYTDMIQVGYK